MKELTFAGALLTTLLGLTDWLMGTHILPTVFEVIKNIFS